MEAFILFQKPIHFQLLLFQQMTEDETLWYIADGGPTPQGPLTLRDVDVKFRIGSLKSTYFAWSEQIGGDWKPISEIPELRKILEESAAEVTSDIQKQIPQKENDDDDKKDAKEKKKEEEGSEGVESDGGLAYYNPQEKVYKVFDVESSTWKTQEERPSKEQIAQMKQNMEEKKAEEPQAAPAEGEEGAQAKDDPAAEEPPIPLLTEEEIKKREAKKIKRKRAQLNKKKRWFDTANNTFVYMNGLPTDITMDELSEFARKCGIIKLDQNTGEPKIKIYTDEEGKPKGDARICYQNTESVQEAADWLNGSQIRPGFPVHVEQANFEQKGEEYRPRETQKVDKIEKLRIKAQQERQKYCWDEDEMHDIGLKIVVLENFYTMEEVQQSAEVYQHMKDPVAHFFKEIDGELREEVEQKVGPIDKVEVFKENPVCKIKFKSALHAEACIKLMDDRYFCYRKLKCYFWDGKVDYKKNRETDKITQERVEQFGQWLEGEDLPEELQPKKEVDKEEVDVDITQRKRDIKAESKLALQDLSDEPEDQ